MASSPARTSSAAYGPADAWTSATATWAAGGQRTEPRRWVGSSRPSRWSATTCGRRCRRRGRRSRCRRAAPPRWRRTGRLRRGCTPRWRPASDRRAQPPPADPGWRSRRRARRGRRPAAPGPRAGERTAAGSARRGAQSVRPRPAGPLSCCQLPQTRARLRTRTTAQARAALVTGRRPGRRINRAADRGSRARPRQRRDDLGATSRRPPARRTARVRDARSAGTRRPRGAVPSERVAAVRGPCPHSGTSARSPATARPVSSSCRASSGPSSPAVPPPGRHQVEEGVPLGCGDGRPRRRGCATVRPPSVGRSRSAARYGRTSTGVRLGQLVGGPELTQRTDRRRALTGRGPAGQGRRERGGVDRAGARRPGCSRTSVQILGQVGRVGQVDAERQRRRAPPGRRRRCAAPAAAAARPARTASSCARPA